MSNEESEVTGGQISNILQVALYLLALVLGVGIATALAVTIGEKLEGLSFTKPETTETPAHDAETETREEGGTP